MNVTEKIFKMPTGPWPKDPKLRLVGAFEQENLWVNLDGISLRVFQKGLGWSAEETSVFLAGVRKDIKDRRIHAYYPYYVVYAQKPMGRARRTDLEEPEVVTEQPPAPSTSTADTKPEPET